MVISKKNNYCFVAVPKTGTTAITAQLLKDSTAVRNRVFMGDSQAEVGEHDDAKKLLEVMGEEHWSRLYSFAFVRNPWDRVVSTYFYYRTGRAAETVITGKNKEYLKSKKGKVFLFLKVMLAKGLPFNIWVLIYRTRQHADFVTDRSGKLMVSDVYKFETLEDDFCAVCEKIGIKYNNLKKENVSNHKGYQTYYNKLSRCLVASRFERDIRLFGYKF